MLINLAYVQVARGGLAVGSVSGTNTRRTALTS